MPSIRTFLPAVGAIAKGVIEFDSKFGTKVRANLASQPSLLTAYNNIVTAAQILVVLLQVYEP